MIFFWVLGIFAALYFVVLQVGGVFTASYFVVLRIGGILGVFGVFAVSYFVVLRIGGVFAVTLHTSNSVLPYNQLFLRGRIFCVVFQNAHFFALILCV